MVKGFSFLSSDSFDVFSSIFWPALTLRIIPKAIQVIHAAVPSTADQMGEFAPLREKPVRATAIFTKAWMMMGNPKSQNQKFSIDRIGFMGNDNNSKQYYNEIQQDQSSTAHQSKFFNDNGIDKIGGALGQESFS